MIETEQTAVVDAAIAPVWDYVREMQRWARIMPGYQDCEIINENDSRWILKVGVGGLVRTVKVLVHVDQWDGPERVTFSFKLDGDPVQGSGIYTAAPQGADKTEITLKVCVEGSGPMAPMWEAMGGPLLPKFARSFADQLKGEIEAAVSTPAPQAVSAAPAPSLLAQLGNWLRSIWRTLRGAVSP